MPPTQLRPEALEAHLAKHLAPLYVIHGDEPLTALEAADAVRAAARRAGCEDREIFVAEQHFRWDGFVGANANLGLFGSRKLVDLRIPSGKPGVEGAAVLARYAENPNPDNITLITLPRLDRATQSSAWF
ncbi:MAG: DNA polymerase III subunit delta, partial [Casimicrobiaceae bacterium]